MPGIKHGALPNEYQNPQLLYLMQTEGSEANPLLFCTTVVFSTMYLEQKLQI